jgi:hypothetical protein
MAAPEGEVAGILTGFAHEGRAGAGLLGGRHAVGIGGVVADTHGGWSPVIEEPDAGPPIEIGSISYRPLVRNGLWHEGV